MGEAQVRLDVLSLRCLPDSRRVSAGVRGSVWSPGGEIQAQNEHFG